MEEGSSRVPSRRVSPRMQYKYSAVAVDRYVVAGVSVKLSSTSRSTGRWERLGEGSAREVGGQWARPRGAGRPAAASSRARAGVEWRWREASAAGERTV